MVPLTLPVAADWVEAGADEGITWAPASAATSEEKKRTVHAVATKPKRTFFPTGLPKNSSPRRLTAIPPGKDHALTIIKLADFLLEVGKPAGKVAMMDI
jgi:hypothetical protein